MLSLCVLFGHNVPLGNFYIFIDFSFLYLWLAHLYFAHSECYIFRGGHHLNTPKKHHYRMVNKLLSGVDRKQIVKAKYLLLRNNSKAFEKIDFLKTYTKSMLQNLRRILWVHY